MRTAGFTLELTLLQCHCSGFWLRADRSVLSACIQIAAKGQTMQCNRPKAIEGLPSVCIFDKVFASFWHSTCKNLHKNKLHVYWHAQVRFCHGVWLVKKTTTHVSWHLRFEVERQMKFVKHTQCQPRPGSVIRYCFPVASWEGVWDIEWKQHLSRWLLVRG